MYACCVPADKGKSFYCGDAAGRVEGWKPKAKKDFSDSDRKFAMNVGIKVGCIVRRIRPLFLSSVPRENHLSFFVSSVYPLRFGSEIRDERRDSCELHSAGRMAIA